MRKTEQMKRLVPTLAVRVVYGTKTRGGGRREGDAAKRRLFFVGRFANTNIFRRSRSHSLVSVRAADSNGWSRIFGKFFLAIYKQVVRVVFKDNKGFVIVSIASFLARKCFNFVAMHGKTEAEDVFSLIIHCWWISRTIWAAFSFDFEAGTRLTWICISTFQ